MNKIEILNKLLAVAYKFGFEVGYCWYKPAEVSDTSGHLFHEDLYLKQANELAKELAPWLGLTEDEILVYMLEDCSIHENDWQYIAPEIAKRGQ